MKNMLAEFKDFINNGSLVDLAIAFIMALFFAPIVTAIVDGVIMRLIAAIFGKPDFHSITLDVGDAELLIGTVLTTIVQFLIVALVCFLIVKQVNKMNGPEEEVASGPTEVELLTEIRDSLRANS